GEHAHDRAGGGDEVTPRHGPEIASGDAAVGLEPPERGRRVAQDSLVEPYLLGLAARRLERLKRRSLEPRLRARELGGRDDLSLQEGDLVVELGLDLRHLASGADGREYLVESGVAKGRDPAAQLHRELLLQDAALVEP